MVLEETLEPLPARIGQLVLRDGTLVHQRAHFVLLDVLAELLPDDILVELVVVAEELDLAEHTRHELLHVFAVVLEVALQHFDGISRQNVRLGRALANVPPDFGLLGRGQGLLCE